LPKNINPANAPKIRPIEDFWGKKVQLCLIKMDLNLVQRIAGSVQTRVDTLHRYGYDAL